LRGATQKEHRHEYQPDLRSVWTVITGETEEELVTNVQAYARVHQNTELSRERAK
jgi:predicted RNase H-like HicB family nuclease